jgi:hypothetical protein
MHLAGGAFIFLAFMIVMFFAVAWSYFTVKGSGISETPYGKIYSGAPGAGRKPAASGHDDRVVMREWSRGTR